MSAEPRFLVPRQLRPGADRLEVWTPFAVMFRDSFDGRVVAAGLRVELSDPVTRRMQALEANTQGIFVAHRLPRIRPEDADASPSPRRAFGLRVRDLRGRFLPLRLSPELPVAGLLDPDGPASPPADLPFIPLYSASTRGLGGGVGLLRAQLRRASDPDAPLSWARVELWAGVLRLGEGLADAGGEVLLPCHLPPPRDPPLHGSPPEPDAGFERNRWDVQLRAYWDPALAAEPVPDLQAVRAQPEVPLLRNAGSPPEPLGALVLRPGATLVARSDASSFLFAGA
ncbi:hypothetical protein H8N03_10745 [Ramlibacter sp. USB13]|uniref:Uncharacterized protein n=1 Tax=Ramlibacter cellulosilyticus TaxID=2764187 RepID=A0A923MRE3_9BURK|nr:hypothetical protein [Ramlibacter cellulosilyticus]MBC5783423.1 hypothetical protein [Ramlibacter cellulosilyticus]